MNKDELIFISGGMTGIPDFEERFFKAENHLINMGFKRIINPARIGAALPELNHDQYLKIDLVALMQCKYIYMLKDWEHSLGSSIEHDYATKNNIVILKEE